MKYSKVFVDTINYELPPVVVSSDDLEDRLAPMYEKLLIRKGQLEALTGIYERRWWHEGYRLSDGAIAAAQKAIHATSIHPQDIGALIYAGVCREGFEPATACRVAAEVGVSPSAAVYDISNACLGVLNGILDIANRIELGDIRAGMVVSCETAREINEVIIEEMIAEMSMKKFRASLATLTGGSGAIAVLLTDGSFDAPNASHKLLGGVTHTAPEHNDLCRWGLDTLEHGLHKQFMRTDAVSVLRHGVVLGKRTWEAFLAEQGWTVEQVDKVICHQVGSANQKAILKALGVPSEKDFTSFEFLGNIGTVSLPITAALATERQFLERGDNVAFLGIGSGLNCMMLALEW